VIPVEPKLLGNKIRVAENQPEYTPVTVVVAHNPDFRAPLSPKAMNSVIMAFSLTAEERRRIALGENTIYVSLLTFGNLQQPILLTVGAEEMAERFSLDVLQHCGTVQPEDEADALAHPNALGGSITDGSEGAEQL
jgi:hypothetical protein